MNNTKKDPIQKSVAPDNVHKLMRQSEIIAKYSYDAIIGSTLDGIITSWSGGAERMFGYTEEEVLGKSGASLFPPEMWERVPALLKKIEKKETVADYDIDGLRKDGMRFNMAVSISPVITEEGKVIGASIIERDITNRVETLKIMSLYRKLIENSYDSIIGENLEGVITSWNNGAEMMFGYTEKEAVGKSAIMLFPPEEKDDLFLIIEKLKAGEVITDYDGIRVHKNGSRINVSIAMHSELDENKKVIGISVIERDITERIKSIEKLKKSQNLLNSATEAGKIGVWKLNLADDTAETSLLHDQIFGYDKKLDKWSKAMILNQIIPEDKPRFQAAFDNVAETGRLLFQCRIVWQDKSIHWISAEGKLIRDDNGKPLEIYGTVMDITELKNNIEHIKELNDIHREFITIISHQLRTPLTAVNWNLEMLLNGDFGKLEDTQHKFLQATCEASHEITMRIDDLLTAMDIEEGRLVLEKKEMALDSICAGVMDEIKKRCELKNISLTYTPPIGDLPAAIGDGAKMRIVFMKIMENAIDYTKEGGLITAALTYDGKVVRFEVKDSGIGIPTPEQHRVFTRFFRASNAINLRTDAFGLGLFLGKNFVEQHQGKIGFKSKEGEGSIFWLEIPLQLASLA